MRGIWFDVIVPFAIKIVLEKILKTHSCDILPCPFNGVKEILFPKFPI
jgi:hypothetical protein